MTLEQFGLFTWMLYHSWVFGERPCHLPNDPETIVFLLKINSESFDRCWPAVSKKWVETDDGKFIYNKRLLSEYEKCVGRSKTYSNNRLGKKKSIDKQLIINSKSIDNQLKINSKSIDRQAVDGEKSLVYEKYIVSVFWKKIKDGGTTMRSPDTEEWAKEIDSIHRRDKKGYWEIMCMIAACFKDPFWAKNIRSPAALRRAWQKGSLDKLLPVLEEYGAKTDQEAIEHINAKMAQNG